MLHSLGIESIKTQNLVITAEYRIVMAVPAGSNQYIKPVLAQSRRVYWVSLYTCKVREMARYCAG